MPDTDNLMDKAGKVLEGQLAIMFNYGHWILCGGMLRFALEALLTGQTAAGSALGGGATMGLLVGEFLRRCMKSSSNEPLHYLVSAGVELPNRFISVVVGAFFSGIVLWMTR